MIALKHKQMAQLRGDTRSALDVAVLGPRETILDIYRLAMHCEVGFTLTSIFWHRGVQRTVQGDMRLVISGECQSVTYSWLAHQIRLHYPQLEFLYKATVMPMCSARHGLLIRPVMLRYSNATQRV